MDKADVEREVLIHLKSYPKTSVVSINAHILSVLEKKGIAGHIVETRPGMVYTHDEPMPESIQDLIDEVIWDLICQRKITPCLRRGTIDFLSLAPENR